MAWICGVGFRATRVRGSRFQSVFGIDIWDYSRDICLGLRVDRVSEN